MLVLLGIVVIGFVAFVLIGAFTGRVKAESCCSLSASDPRRDLRMAPAFEDDAS